MANINLLSPFHILDVLRRDGRRVHGRFRDRLVVVAAVVGDHVDGDGVGLVGVVGRCREPARVDGFIGFGGGPFRGGVSGRRGICQRERKQGFNSSAVWN